MALKHQMFRLPNERYIFAFVLLINIVLVCSLRFIPSMDGPAHLYNSNILLNLIKGDPSAFNEFFKINSLFIPNWTGHFLLSLFMLVMPPWLAEKLILCLYITGLSLSFRILLKLVNPENSPLSIFIFPFLYSFLFHLGFYNYSISFIFCFYTIYYWLKKRDKLSFINSIKLMVLMTLTCYTAVLTFLFLGFSLGLLELSGKFSFRQITDRKNINRILVLFIAALPGIILLTVFYSRTIFHGTGERVNAAELLKWLNDVRPLIVYNYMKEEILTEHILHILVIMLGISVFYRFIIHEPVIFRPVDYLIIPALLALILLFVIPSGDFAGMMSDRLALMFYMIFLFVVLSQKYPRKLWYFAVPPVLMIHFILLGFHYDKTIRHLNKDAILVQCTADKIPEGSIVLPVDMTGNWLEIHFSNYLGTERDLIILDNYQASAGWFPVSWNPEKMPDILIGERSSIKGINWQTNSDSEETRQIEYIFLYGNTDQIDKPEYEDLSVVLKNNFTLVYRSGNNYISLYRRREN